jgi:hypothetical protein
MLHVRDGKKKETRFSSNERRKEGKIFLEFFSTLIDASKFFPRLFSEM